MTVAAYDEFLKQSAILHRETVTLWRTFRDVELRQLACTEDVNHLTALLCVANAHGVALALVEEA